MKSKQRGSYAGLRAFTVDAATLWNALPGAFRGADSLKSLLKAHVFV